MKSRKKLILLAILFIISIGSFSRNTNTIDIRSVDFLSIFAVGAISALFLREIIQALKNR